MIGQCSSRRQSAQPEARRLGVLFFVVCVASLGTTSAAAQSESPIAPLPADLTRSLLQSDKALHAGGSAAMTIAAYGTIAWLTDERWARVVVAGGAVAFAGVAKEGVDIARGGQADLLDLAADAAGIAVGLGVMAALETFFWWARAHPAPNEARVQTAASWTPRPQKLQWTGAQLME